MKRPDIDSLLRWRASLEEQRQVLDKAIAECDRQLKYFNGDQQEIPLMSELSTSESPEFSGKDLRECILTIFKRNKDVDLSKKQIMEKLEDGGFRVNDPSFTMKFNGILGSFVKFKVIEKVATGVFKLSREIGITDLG